MNLFKFININDSQSEISPKISNNAWPLFSPLPYLVWLQLCRIFLPTISWGQLSICFALLKVACACKHICVSFSSSTQMFHTFLILWLGALFSAVTSILCNGVRGTRLLETERDGKGSRYSAEEVVSTPPYQNGLGIRLLRSAHAHFPRLSCCCRLALLLPPQRCSSKAGLISLHLPLSFPRLQCKISSFFFAICFTSLSIPKPQLSLFKITPNRAGLPFMSTGTKLLKRFIEVNLCTIEFFLREICNY